LVHVMKRQRTSSACSKPSGADNCENHDKPGDAGRCDS
jgi:hypothetical protein